MALNQLQLSLQFARFDGVAAHRAALPRHAAARFIRHALSSDAEIPMRFDIVSVTLAPAPDEAVRHIALLRGAFLAPDD